MRGQKGEEDAVGEWRSDDGYVCDIPAVWVGDVLWVLSGLSRGDALPASGGVRVLIRGCPKRESDAGRGVCGGSAVPITGDVWVCFDGMLLATGDANGSGEREFDGIDATDVMGDVMSVPTSYDVGCASSHGAIGVALPLRLRKGEEEEEE